MQELNNIKKVKALNFSMKNFFINDLLPEGFKVLLPEEAHKKNIKINSRLIFSKWISISKTPMMEYEDNISQNTLNLT